MKRIKAKITERLNWVVSEDTTGFGCVKEVRKSKITVKIDNKQTCTFTVPPEFDGQVGDNIQMDSMRA